MQENRPLLLSGRPEPTITPRSVFTVLFRQKRLILIVFCAVFIPILIAVNVLPGEYVSETKIVVERQRFDPVITSGFRAESSSAPSLTRLDEQDIDSEIDLLQSDDLLRQVVIACKLWQKVPRWRSVLPLPMSSPEKRIAKAVQGLRKGLMVDPPNKSNVVTVRFYSHDPQQAAQILQSITNVYLEKHLQIHRPAGSTEFFNGEVERNHRALQEAEAKLTDFTKSERVVAADVEGSAMLQKIGDFDASLQNTRSQIAATQQRIADLSSQLNNGSSRITTQVKSSSVLLESLKTTLFSLELKRSELLTQYQQSYPPVQELESQIADTHAAIAAAEQAPTAERTTDLDPVHLWAQSELAKARAELVSLRASAAQIQGTLQEYRTRAVHLEQLQTQQDDLKRLERLGADAYQASLREQSEARMSEALDRAQIMNVAVAEPASVPALPTASPLLKLVLGCILALIVSLGLAFAADYCDPSFRTPQEVEVFLKVPVLAALPHPKALSGDNDDAMSSPYLAA